MKSYRSVYIGCGFIAGMYKSVCDMTKCGDKKAKFLTIYDINLLASMISAEYNEKIKNKDGNDYIVMHSGPVLLKSMKDSTAEYILSQEDNDKCAKAVSGVTSDKFENNIEIEKRYEIARELYSAMMTSGMYNFYKKDIEEPFKKLYYYQDLLEDFYGKGYKSNENFNTAEKRRMHLMANFYYIDDEYLRNAGCNRSISLSRDIVPIFKQYVEKYPFYKFTILPKNVKMANLRNFINGGPNTCIIDEKALNEAIILAVNKFNSMGLYKNNNAKWTELKALKNNMDALLQEVD